jgi:hypothetical protein
MDNLSRNICKKDLTFYSQLDSMKAMKTKIYKKLIADLQKHSISSMSLRIKVPYATLWRIINGDGGCNMRTWEKIEKYYE